MFDATFLFVLLCITAVCSLVSIILNIHAFKHLSQKTFLLLTEQEKNRHALTLTLQEVRLDIQQKIETQAQAHHDRFTQQVQQQMIDVREQINHSFQQHTHGLTTHLKSLTEEIRQQLSQMTHQVHHRLMEGFEKTSSTFTDIVKRLAIIDEAQKKITELSSHVVGLQDILSDKKSRGAFGEVQLESLISNMMPSTHYQMQYTLSNQKRADCILFLPDPTGHLVVDAKFPLENYQRLMSTDPSTAERKTLQQQFRQDLQKHIKDISEKYIIPHETADSAVMFIPAEAIFAEIHAHYPEIIALSQRMRVWLVSPSTLMAVLTTARAVLKDDATKKQVHVIQKHLQALADDFQRFEKRMDNLSKHIEKAHQDVNEVNISAKKITQRFQRIESVEMNAEELDYSTEFLN